MTDIFPESREEEILVSTINGEEYDKAPESRIEALLLELKEVIEEGGGGGGTTNYNLLQNKPSINSVTLTGNKSLEDLSIPTAADLAGKQDVLPVAASGNDVAFNGDIQDGQGNTLSVLAEALTKTASGNPVVITDCAGGKARSLITEINAIQDLHGYDKPWVGGADINLLDLKSRFPDNAKSVTSDGVTYTRVDDADGNPIGVQASNTATGYSYCDVQLTLEAGRYKSAVTGIEANKMSLNFRKGTNREYFKAANEEFTLTEQTLIFVRYTVNQGDTANNTIKCMIYKYDGTDKTFRPYSNICPISGRTAVTISRYSNNLVNADELEDDKYLDGTGTAVYNVDCYITGFIPLKSGQPIYIPATGTARRCTYYADKSFKEYLNVSAAQVLTPNFDGYLRVSVRYDTIAKNDLQINYGSAAIPFEPQGIDTIIQLGQTVYGCSVDFTTGAASVKWAAVDFGDISWTYNGTNFVTTDITGGVAKTGKTCMCSCYDAVNNVPYSTDTIADNSICMSTVTAERVYVHDSAYTDAGAFKTARTGQTICYELAAPIELTLTPTELQMLKGYNRVTIESGSIEIEYIAKAISGNDEEIAPLVGDKATKSYAVNDFIERADGLYRVTASIASGASFTANNTVKMSIGEALTYLYNK
jgi:hypothetical protein